MSREVRWLPNWYATRMHAVSEGLVAVCGAHVVDPENPVERGRGWRNRRLAKGPPRCAHCVRMLDAPESAAAQRTTTLEAENATLRTLLTECADELEWRIQDRYGARNQVGDVDADRIHPAMRGKYDDDMDTVLRARRALEGP